MFWIRGRLWEVVAKKGGRTWRFECIYFFYYYLTRVLRFELAMYPKLQDVSVYLVNQSIKQSINQSIRIERSIRYLPVLQSITNFNLT